MAPQKSDNENIGFLYTCFKSAVTNGGKVDLASVAAAHHINVPAASMRLSRLRKYLDSRVGQEENGGGKDDAADVTPKAPKTPTSKGKGAIPISASKDKGSETNIVTPTPKNKNKKRKIAEVEQAAVEQARDQWTKDE